jgi:hypothetical protein
MRPCHGIRRYGSCSSLGGASGESAGKNKGKSKARDMWVTITRTEVTPRRPCGRQKCQYKNCDGWLSGSWQSRLRHGGPGTETHLNPFDVSLVRPCAHGACPAATLDPVQQRRAKGQRNEGNNAGRTQWHRWFPNGPDQNFQVTGRGWRAEPGGRDSPRSDPRQRTQSGVL